GIRDRTVTGVQTCALPIYAGRRNLVAIDRAADLKAVENGWPRKEARKPRAIVIDVAAVAGAADGCPATVTQAGVVAQAEFAGRRSEERRVGKECRGGRGGE